VASTIVLGDDRRDHAEFAEPNFWTLFGGRRTTLTQLDF